MSSVTLYKKWIAQGHPEQHVELIPAVGRDGCWSCGSRMLAI